MPKSNKISKVEVVLILFLLVFLSSDANLQVSAQSKLVSQEAQDSPYLSKLTTEKSLRELGDENGLHIGAAVSQWETWDPLFLSTMRREFNTMSASWEAFWTQIHPEPDRYDFDELDNLVEIAERYNMSLNYRGDVVWMLGYPAYLAYNDPAGGINQKSNLTRIELLSYLNNHIETVFGHYKGKFDSIYVVNEPLETKYNETTWQPLPTEMRHSFWYDNIGPDYIEIAFNKTHEVDPDAKLFINEGLWWGVNPAIAADRTNVFYNLVVRLLNERVPIHGIGLQYYFDVPIRYPWIQSIDWDQIHDETKLFHDLGLEIHLSEVGIPIIGEVTQEKLQNQSILCRKLVDLALEFENVTLLNTWGIADDHSYLWTAAGSSAPLLFDSNYNPKPAYYAIKERLAGVTSIYRHDFSDPSINFDPTPPRDYRWATRTPFKIQYEIITANQSGTGAWKLSNGDQTLGELRPGDKFSVEFSGLNGDYGTRLYWNRSDYMDARIYGDGFYDVYEADYSVYDAGFFIQQVPFPYMPEWIHYVPKNPPGRIRWEDITEMFYTHSYYSYKDPDMEIINNDSSYGFVVENANYSFQQICNKTTGILEYYHRNHMNDADLDLNLEFSICDFEASWSSTDVNHDGTVNILDMSIVARAFGSKQGMPNWNQSADLNEDGVVNILDIGLVARDFGKRFLTARALFDEFAPSVLYPLQVQDK